MELESPPHKAHRQIASAPQCSSGLAFAIYLALSLLFFGRGLVGHISDRYIGVGTDPGLFIFFLEWWKYVFTHHVNPFFTYLQWAPSGSNLAWATCIPLFGIAAIPLTSTLGPIATFNLLTLLCLPLAAWTAFLLCRYVSSSSWAAVIGGYVFGFSPWMLSHLLGHLTVLMMFPVPLMVLVALRRLKEEITTGSFTISLTALVVALFLCWPEAVATATMFGGIAMALTWLTARPWRAGLQRLILPTSLSYVASAIILSPYLYYFFAFGQPAFPGGLRQVVAVRPLNFLIPTVVNLLGTLPLFPSLLSGHIYEAGAYIALPLLLIVVIYARRHRSEWLSRLQVNLLLIIAIASLGSMLFISSRSSIPLPWGILWRLPLVDKALPARFSVYGFLVLSIILTLWLSEGTAHTRTRIIGACSVVLFTLPNLSSAFWVTPVDTPAFFQTGEYKSYIAPGDNVLVLPYGEVGNSNIWQAATGFYFRMAGGYLGQPPIPTEYLPYFPIVYDLYNMADSPDAVELLKIFLAQKQVNSIVVADQGAHLWRNSLKSGPQFPEATALDSDERTTLGSFFNALGVAPVRSGGVTFYQVPLDRLEAYKNVDPAARETRIADIQLGALIHAAARYVSDGRPLSDLSPIAAQRLGLLPPRWISGVGIFDPRAPIHNGLVLTSVPNGDVMVGVIATQEIIEALAGKYRTFAQKVEISPLIGIAGWAESSRWILLLDYDRSGLASAVARANAK
jgi:hypothetical protein